MSIILNVLHDFTIASQECETPATLQQCHKGGTGDYPMDIIEASEKCWTTAARSLPKTYNAGLLSTPRFEWDLAPPAKGIQMCCLCTFERMTTLHRGYVRYVGRSP